MTHHDYELGVRSETAPLRRVIVHAPGPELELIDPGRRLDMLFDDILCVETARREHQTMCEAFTALTGGRNAPDGRHGPVVLHLTELLLQALARDDARAAMIDQLIALDGDHNLRLLRSELDRLAPAELRRFAMTGRASDDVGVGVSLPPLPNLMFTRDLAAVVGDWVILSAPATPARARESLIIEIVLRHHPAFASSRERILQLPPGVTFEGGDLLVASEEVVLIGLSERTSFGAIMAIAAALFARTPVRHVVMVDLPRQRASMHLDTVFTFAGPSTCVAFPPLFPDHEGGAQPRIYHLTPAPDGDGREVRCRPGGTLRGLLGELLGRELTFLQCGGADPLSQRREQWTDGANLFAIAPGIAMGYARNHRTWDEMRDHGFRVIDAADVVAGQLSPGPEDRVAVRLAGTELSRGRGGPRCMTLTVQRAD